jgi:hypothetical protein
MIKMSELKHGDIVLAEYEGQRWEGMVKELNKEDKEVCVETSVQDFWFKPEDLYPVPVSDEQLLKIGFTRHVNDDGSVKYMKDSFRLLCPKRNDFSNVEIWWREDHRYLNYHLNMHELQNHYLQMTKIELLPA